MSDASEEIEQAYRGPTVDIRPRMGGKTTAMLQLIADMDDPSEAVVIVHSDNYAKQLRGIYTKRHHGRPVPRFVSHRQRDQLQGLNRPRICVDNVDILLAEMFGTVPEYVTMTGRLAND